MPHRFVYALITLVLLTLVSGQPVLAEDKVVKYDDNPILATIDGKSITISDIEDKDLNSTRIELYQQMRARLLVKSIQELAKNYPTYGVEPDVQVSDKEVTNFYYANQLQNRGPLESLKPHIKVLLEARVKMSYLESLYAKAEKEGLIKSYLTEPETLLIQVPLETAYIWGNKSEPVMVLEFSDYQCPFCSRVQTTLNSLRTKYQNRVAFAYRHSPLPFHQEADEAAIAAECAKDQGKFSPLHKLLFANFRNITIKKLPDFAEEAGIDDMRQFNKCLNTEKYRPLLENDQKAASAAGISGTPGFIIGYYDAKNNIVKGELLSGAVPEQQFVQLIEKYLNR